MARPQVSLPTENRIAELRAHLDRTLPQFTQLDGVVGITLNGGMSRGYADHYSEVDITLFLEPDAYRRWSKGGMPGLPAGIVKLNGQLYDLKVCDLAAETEGAWSDVTQWDASYAEVLHDPTGRVSALLSRKLADPPRIAGAGGLLFDAWWHIHLATPIWIHRQDGLQAHLMLNRAVEPVIRALFLANGEHVPHEKWLVHMSRSLAWKPERWEERLAAAMTAQAPTVEAAAERREVLAGLWAEVDRHLVEQLLPGCPLNLMHRFFYEQLCWLMESGSVSLAEWEERAPASMLHRAPFYACVVLEEGRVRLDPDRLAGLGPDDMDPWFYAVVAAARRW